MPHLYSTYLRSCLPGVPRILLLGLPLLIGLFGMPRDALASDALASDALASDALASAHGSNGSDPERKTSPMAARAALDSITAAQIIDVYAAHGLTAYPATQADWVSQLNHGNYGWDHFLDNMARSYGASAEDVTRVYAEHGEVADTSTQRYWINQTKIGSATGQYGWDNFRNEIAREKHATAADVARIFASHGEASPASQANWLQQLTTTNDWNGFLDAMRNQYGPSAQDIVNAYGYHRQIAVGATQDYWLTQLGPLPLADGAWDRFLDALVAAYGASNEDIRRIYAAHGQPAAGETQEDWVRRLAAGFGWTQFQMAISNLYGGTPAEIVHLFEIHNIPIQPNTVADLTYDFTHGLATWYDFQNNLAVFWGATRDDIVRIYAGLGQIALVPTQTDWVNQINVLHTFSFAQFVVAVTIYYAPSVAVAPNLTTVTQPANVTHTQPFTITNTGTGQAAFNYTVTCSANLACQASSASGTTAVLQPQSSQVLSIQHQVPSSGASGTITLTASHTTVPAATAAGTVTIVALADSTLTVVTRTVNSGAAIERGGCVTVGIGPSAAYECGDLRLSHVLPAVTTYGKSRAPVLTYVSRHAAPVALLAADVTVEPGTTPSMLDASVTVENMATATAGLSHSVVHRRIPWSPGWSNGIARRIVVPVNADEANLPTGVYHYTLEVKPSTDASSATAARDTGTFTIIDRRESPYGSGWWLDGLEVLQIVDVNTRLWIGGDGNARLYRRTLNEAFVATQQLDGPDTLLVYGAMTRRVLRNKGYVEFDSYGRQVATRDALGRVTTFHYAGASRVDTVTLPSPAGATRRYTFDYGEDTDHLPRLAVVHAPSGTGGDRPTYLWASTGAVDSIRFLPSTDVASALVKFGYQSGAAIPGGATKHLTSRTDRANVTTSYGYDAGTLRTGRIGMAPRADIVNTFCAAEAVSVTACGGTALPLVADVATTWDGPRDIADLTTFTVDRFGAPTRIVNALGYPTRIVRDALFPALADSVIQPNGFTTVARYNSRGLPDSVTAVNPVNTGENATTRYHYHGTWDLADTITAPLGGKTMVGYDADLPLARWQQDGRGETSRATFDYTFGTHQLSLATPPGNAVGVGTRLEYDELGNLSQTTTALGFVTTHARDYIGQDTLTTAPTDSAQTPGLRTRTGLHYNPEGAVTLQWSTSAPTAFPLSLGSSAILGATIAVPEDSLEVITDYKDGRVWQTYRTAYPDRAGLGDRLQHTMEYDGAGRVTTTQSPNAGRHGYAYDPAGNLMADTLPGPDTLSMGGVLTFEYDALNRLTKRVQLARSVASTQACSIVWGNPWFRPLETSFFCHQPGYSFRFPLWSDFAVPRDSDTFVYDTMGRMTEARNGSAIVGRTYANGGALLTDTLHIRTYGTGSSDEWTAHLYPLTYTYDIEGRRKSLSYPSRSVYAACASGSPCTQRYNYNVFTGLLETTTDVGDHPFEMTYDGAGRLTSRSAPAVGVSENFEYDADGRLRHRTEAAGARVIHNDWYGRDAQGRVTDLQTTFGTPNGGETQHLINSYTGLGALVGIQTSKNSQQADVELFQVDAFGNQVWRETISPETQFRLDRYTYWPKTERVKEIIGDTAAQWAVRTPTLSYQKMTYTPSGAVEWSASHTFGYAGAGLTGPTEVVASRSFYQPDGKLRAYSRDGTPGKRSTKALYEEYRYDALGRRVLERARADTVCHDAGPCREAITRSVWDGDQLLMEERSAVGHEATAGQLEGIVVPLLPVTYGGMVAYTHAGGIDAPVGLYRNGRFIVPHANWRGAYDSGTDTTGGRVAGDVDWPGNTQRAYFVWGGLEENVGWTGALITKQRDESGLLYMRNRYFDPGSGRFTQEDPIGLAGGMNLYGFAGGDPVNFSDPFGLCGVANDDADGGTGDDSTKSRRRTTRVSCDYAQSTGTLSCTTDGGDSFSETGYSGMGIFKNWAASESYQNHGPIPAGDYTIGKALPDKNYKGKGPVVMRLTPSSGNQMFGRAGFLIHGDNKTHTASEGCVIMSRSTREKLAVGGSLSVKY